MYEILVNISVFSVWFPTLCVLFYYRQIKAVSAPFVYMILMMCITDMTSNTLAEMGIYTIWLFLIYTVMEYGFMLWTQRSMMKKPMSVPVLLSIVFVAAVVVIDCVFFCHFDNFNSLSRSTEAMLLIGHSLYALYFIQQTKEHLFLQHSPLFWLAFGTLFYMSGSFFVFIMEGQKYQYAGLGKEIWSVHSVFNVFFNLFLAKTALCLKHPSSSP
jgi:hypothetical protein